MEMEHDIVLSLGPVLRRRWRTSTVAAIGAIFIGWLVFGESREELRQRIWDEEFQAREKARTARERAWEKQHPGKLYDRSQRLQVAAQLPVDVVDVTDNGDRVLLANGISLGRLDLLDLHIDPQAPLPMPVANFARIVADTMKKPPIYDVQGFGAVLWSDGLMIGSPDILFGPPRELFFWDHAADKVGGTFARLEFDERWQWVRPPSDSASSPAPPVMLHDAMAIATTPLRDSTVVLRLNGDVHVFGDPKWSALIGSAVGVSPDGIGGFVLDKAVAVAAGTGHALALRKDGTVWTWAGSVPRDEAAPVAEDPPRRVGTLHDIVRIAAGFGSGFAVDRSGHVWSWGYARCGSLGRVVHTHSDAGRMPEDTLPFEEPAIIEGLDAVVDIKAVGFHALALRADGSVWGWGLNGRGQLGAPESKDWDREETCDSTMNLRLVSEPIRRPRPLRNVSHAKAVFVAPGMSAIATDDGGLWFIGAGCFLCEEWTLAILDRNVRAWGVAAGKGMWCDRREEVTALRRAVDDFLNVRFPPTRPRMAFGRWGADRHSGDREVKKVGFRSAAEWIYRYGFDPQTMAIRRAAGNDPHQRNVESTPSQDSDIWVEALDIWNARPGSLTVSADPQVMARYRREQCTSAAADIASARSEVARERAAFEAEQPSKVTGSLAEPDGL